MIQSIIAQQCRYGHTLLLKKSRRKDFFFYYFHQRANHTLSHLSSRFHSADTQEGKQQISSALSSSYSLGSPSSGIWRAETLSSVHRVVILRGRTDFWYFINHTSGLWLLCQIKEYISIKVIQFITNSLKSYYPTQKIA